MPLIRNGGVTELYQATGTSSGHTHTITAGANVVFVALMTNFGVDDPSATYCGVAMTLIGGDQLVSATESGRRRSERCRELDDFPGQLGGCG